MDDPKIRRVLQVDKSYLPQKTTTWKNAFKLIIKDHAEALEYYDDWVVHSGQKGRDCYREWQVPAVIRVINKYRQPKKQLQPTRKNVFFRDNYTCQYCGDYYGKSHYGNLELEHINPQSRGGQNTWFNLVTSCRECNGFKGDRTPEEANMQLLRKPRKPSIYDFIRYRLFQENIQPEWEWYIQHLKGAK